MANVSLEKYQARRGRPPKADGAMRQVALRIEPWMLDAVDQIIESRKGQAERTTVLREMIARGLEAFQREQVQ
jgi:hypothetical protein